MSSGAEMKRRRARLERAERSRLKAQRERERCRNAWYRRLFRWLFRRLAGGHFG